MPKIRTPKTPEAKLISDALYARRMSVKSLADHLGLNTENFASQMVNGTKPVPIEYARPIAHLLGLDPSSISPRYRENASDLAASGYAVREGGPLEQAVYNLENDVHAINLVLAALIATAVQHRPAEAAALSAALRKLPKGYAEQGLAFQLRRELDKALPPAKAR